MLFSYSHSDEPLFPCDLCGKKFWGKRQRTHHILATHENKRDHICTYCGKGFHTKAKMIRHSEVVSIVTTECYMLDWLKWYFIIIFLQLHEGINRFKCQLCPQAYGQSHELKKHMLSHKKDA